MPFYLIAENMNVAIFIKTVHLKKNGIKLGYSYWCEWAISIKRN